MTNLYQVNLSDNMLTAVEGLENLEVLDTLYLKRNRIGRNGIEDLKGLLDCPTLTTIDLQNNQIEDPACLEEIFMKMPNLKVLYLQNNPVCKKINYYRKTIIAAIPTLRYLDDRPVFEDDRRNADAFARGGIEEERKERQIMKKEKDDKHMKHHLAFKEMMADARKKRKEALDQKEAAEGAQNDDESDE